jgi:hypothetical protein
MSKAKNPHELVDRYLQAVRFWLPRNKSQRDLLAELGEDLHSQIEERETALGRALNEDDIKAILKNCGSPMLVASRLGPKRSLIGPTLYPVYTFVLKMVLGWILIPVFVIVLIPVSIAKAGGHWATAFAETLGNLWSGAFIAAGIITLIFAILERTGALEGIESKWDPSTLPPLERPAKKPTTQQTACALVFSVLGLIWLLLLPQYPMLILGPAAAILHPDPTLHVFYVPLVLLTILTVLRNAVALARPQWPNFPFSSLVVQEVLTFILLSFALNAAGTPHGGAWHPFVVLADGVRNSPQYAKVPAIVNLSLLAGLLSCWFAFGIAIVVHSWQLIQIKREARSGPQPAASLQAR